MTSSTSERLKDRMVNTSSQLSAQAMVDWPRRPATATEPEGDDMVLHIHAKPELRPKVSFSKVSTLFVYETNGETKSYSKRDQDFFGVEALREALRVKELIAQSPPESTKEYLRFLLKNRSLAIEEMVGIENEILGQGTHTIKKLHAKTVLQKQREQRQNPEDAAENVAKVARESSLKSLLRARACAVFAART